MRIDQVEVTGQMLARLEDVVLLVGDDGSIVDANPAALECYGYSASEMETLSLTDVETRWTKEATEGELREATTRGGGISH